MSGKYVLCVVDATDGGTTKHTMSRSVCLTKPRPECGSCPNQTFKLRFQLRVADQVVLCPQWNSEAAQKERRDPEMYVPTQRGVCLNEKRFSFCASCPNSRASEPPRDQDKWFEHEERARRIELELDEEERE
jgi:hypothetical protein